MKEKEFKGLDLQGKEITYKIIAKFNLNGRQYIFYTDMKNMFVGYYETKKIKNITNIEEYNMLMSIYNQLKVNNFNREFFDYGYTFHKGTNYKMIFDKVERKRYFFELINNRYKEVEGEVKDYFDMKFNVEVLVLNKDNLETKNNIFKNNKFDRIIHISINNTIIPIIIFSGIAISFLQLSPSLLNKEIEINIENDIENMDEVINFIKNNKNLSNEEKAMFLSFEELYSENLNYLNSVILKDNLENFTIKYDENTNGKVTGKYNITKKEVTFYNSKDLSNIELVLHEYLHVLTDNGLAKNFPDANALSEGITEAIAIEYLYKYTNEKIVGSYQKQQVYAKMLAEIIGPEIIKNSYFKADINILLEEINKYLSEKDTYKFFGLINDEIIYENELGAEAFINETTENNKQLKDTQKEIDKTFEKLYLNKYNETLKNDRLMCAYFDQIRKGNRAEYQYYEEGKTFYSEVNKYYFNDHLKSEIATVEYYFSPGIAVKANKEDFKLLPNGQYEYKTDNGEIQIFDQIQVYVLRNKLQDYIYDDNRYKNNEIGDKIK